MSRASPERIREGDRSIANTGKAKQFAVGGFLPRSWETGNPGKRRLTQQKTGISSFLAKS